MGCKHDQKTLPSVATAAAKWQEAGGLDMQRGPARREARMAMMQARQEGATWKVLAKAVGVDATTLRDQMGCMPKHGKRRSGEQAGNGVARTGRSPHSCGDGHAEGAEGHGCGCGKHTDGAEAAGTRCCEKDHGHAHGHGGGCGGGRGRRRGGCGRH